MTTSSDASKRLLRTEAVMRLHSSKALDRFTRVNPQYRGGYWSDCLDILLDSDTHIEVTEPLYEEMAETVTDEQRPYISAVAVTLLWANGAGTVTADAVRHWLVELTKVHKADPQAEDLGVSACKICGRQVKRVPGGQGPVWIHEDTGMVVG